MLLNDYRGVNGKIERSADQIIDTDPALTPCHMTPRCYVNGRVRRDYLVSVYHAVKSPLAYATAPVPGAAGRDWEEVA